MTTLHEQAMQYIYQQVLQRLLEHMSQAQRACVQLLIQRLSVAAGGGEYLGSFRLLVVHGHDTRSAELLALLRAAQLSVALRAPATFHLSVVVACVPAMGAEQAQAHARAFSGLFLTDDPRVDLLMLKGGRAVPFCPRAAALGSGTLREREALLLFAHLTGAGPEALMGSRLHLQLADAYRAVIDTDTPPSALVSAVAAYSRCRYLAWSRSHLRAAGAGRLHGARPCLRTLSQTMAYVHRLACTPLEPMEAPLFDNRYTPPLRLLDLDDLLHGEQGRLAEVMGGSALHLPRSALLGAFVDPVLPAYFTDLHARLNGRPSRLPAALQGQAQQLLQQAYGVGDTQLVCALSAPFSRRGEGLEGFLRVHHPTARALLAQLHAALQGQPCSESAMRWLLDTSGLTLHELRAVYAGHTSTPVWRLLQRLAARDAALRWQAGTTSWRVQPQRASR